MIKIKTDYVIIFIFSICIYFIQSLAWPMHIGRDGGNYLLYYLDMLSAKPVYHLLMVLRTPVAPLFYGLLLSVKSNILIEGAMSLLYGASLLFVYQLSMHWGRKIAYVSVFFINIFPSYGSIYHSVSAEPISSFFLLTWSVFIINTINKPNHLKFIIHALFVFILILTHPTYLILLGFVFFLLFIQTGLKNKIINLISFLVPVALLLLLWSFYNYYRYNDFTISRTSNAQIPLLRAFSISHIVKPENGPNSLELADFVEKELLNKEPYKSNGITKDEFFNKSTRNMYWDLLPLSDRVYGWNFDYKILIKVGLEAINKHPFVYLRGVIRSIGKYMLLSYIPDYIKKNKTMKLENQLNILNSKSDRLIDDSMLRSSLWFCASSPNGEFQPDPNSIQSKYVNPETKRKVDNITFKLNRLSGFLPCRDSYNNIYIAFKCFSTITPPIIFFIIVGIWGLLKNINIYNGILFFFVVTCIVKLIIVTLGLPAILQIRTPFDPFIVIFGLIGAKELVMKYKSYYNRGMNLNLFN